MQEDVKFKHEFTINSLLEDTGSLRDAIGKSDEIVIDATDVRKIDVAALQVLIAVRKECQEKGKRLVLRISDKISHLQTLIGLRPGPCQRALPFAMRRRKWLNLY